MSTMLDGAVPSPRTEPASTESATPTDDATRNSARRRQNLLLVASVGMLVASFMPWIETGFGTFNGFASAGRYLFYVAWIGIAGALVPFRRLAAVQAGIVAAAGVALPTWQCIHLLRLVGFDGWVPGTGMLIIFASGWLALRAAVGLFTE